MHAVEVVEERSAKHPAALVIFALYNIQEAKRFVRMFSQIAVPGYTVLPVFKVEL